MLDRFYYELASENRKRKFDGLASVFKNRALTAIAEIAERYHTPVTLYECRRNESSGIYTIGSIACSYPETHTSKGA